MYYLYHIKGVKWGMTRRGLKVRLKEQGYSLDAVCEIIEETDMIVASDLEEKLNIRDGYKQQAHPYKKYIKYYEKLHTHSSACKKGFVKTEEHKQNISKSKKGKKINWNPLTQNNLKPMPPMPGSKNPRATLTEEQVIEIRNKYNNSNHASMASFHRVYYPNIKKHIITSILKYRSWKHI